MTTLTILDEPEETIGVSHEGHSEGQSRGCQAGLTPHPRQRHQEQGQGLGGGGGGGNRFDTLKLTKGANNNKTIGEIIIIYVDGTLHFFLLTNLTFKSKESGEL